MSAETLIDRRDLPRNEELRVTVHEYRNRPYVSLRKFFPDVTGEPGTYSPGKGLTVSVTLIPFLRAALQRAEHHALEHGLVDEESYDSIGEPLPEALGGERRAA